MNETILHFTDPAVEHIKKSLARFPEGGFRLSVKKTGCSGHKYFPELVAARKAGDIQVIISQGLVVFIDPTCVEMIRGTIVDYAAKGLGQKQLTFNNPNITGACGCGESFYYQKKDDHDHG